MTKLNPSGTALVYSTYLGGTNGVAGDAIAVDAAGSAYVTGTAHSTNFPTTPGDFQTTYGGNGDAFVTKLNPKGTALVYSTYLGGTSYDYGYGIAVDGAGNAYVTGYTASSDFPTTPGAFQTTYAGGNGDAFVTKLNPKGTALVYSTYLGGSDSDGGYGIAVDSAGNAYVTGYTASTDFPTTPGAFQTTFGGNGDAFVTKLNPTGTALVYSTYLGGTRGDLGLGIAVDSAGNAYVTGYTASSDFPTTPGAFQTTYGGNQDAFVTKLNPKGTALVYSTYLGGTSGDFGLGIAVDSAGNAYVTGGTEFTDFPTTAGAYQTTYGGTYDAFVAKFAFEVQSTTTTVVSSVNPSSFGQAVTLTATVTANAPGSGSPTGTVTFYVGPVNPADQIGTGTLSSSSGVMTATLSTSSLPVGTDTITATYSGDGNFLTSTGTLTITINQSIIVLDPSAGGALSLTGNASINIPGVVYVDSGSSTALSASGNAQVTASVIDVHGSVQKKGNASLSPTPITGAQTLADPLSGLALPSTSGMKNYGTENLSGNSSGTIQPGIYKQITVSGNAKLKMSAGVYIIEGGGFSVSGNAGVSGSGVMIFNAGSNYPSTGGSYGSISLSGNGSYSLSPLSSGTYAGIVIFQPKDNTHALSVSGKASGVTGAIYAPAAQLAESGNGQLNAALVVDTLTVGGKGVVDSLPLVAISSAVGPTVTTQDLNIADPPAGTDPQPARPHPQVIPPAVIPAPSSLSSGLMALDLALADGSTTEGWFRGIRDGFRFSRASRS